MSTDLGLLATASQAVSHDLQARPDYGSIRFTLGSDTVTGPEASERFQQFDTLVTVAQKTGGFPPESDLLAVTALTTAIINSNLAMMRMGQLSLARTITPALAEAQNKTLNTFLSLLKSVTADAIVAKTQAPKPAPKPDPKPAPGGISIDPIASERTDSYGMWALSQTGTVTD